MKLISCNIEGDRHFERLLPFFVKEKADILALQEVFESDLEMIKQATGLQNYVFYPQAHVTKDNVHLPTKGLWGIAIFAKEIVNSQAHTYVGDEDYLPEFFFHQNPNSMNRALLMAQVKVKNENFQVATTHFIWSGGPQVTGEQRESYVVLSQFLNQYKEIIFCGDLNTPRGYEIWDDLAKKYVDNIPAEIETTIDRSLHKSGIDIRLVVDALFTSPQYFARNVQVIGNTSDHMAVVGEIEKI